MIWHSTGVRAEDGHDRDDCVGSSCPVVLGGMDDTVAIDVWLRIPEGEEESEAEANTYVTETGYRVEWYLTAVGLVTSREFSELDDAYAWLTREGFENYTS